MRKQFLLALILFFSFCTYAQKIQSFNNSWEFVKDVDSVFTDQLLAKGGSLKWDLTQQT
jgi:hypothetical protein